jgi:hypothetical protein
MSNDLPLIPIAFTGTPLAHRKGLTNFRGHMISLPYYQDTRYS